MRRKEEGAGVRKERGETNIDWVCGHPGGRFLLGGGLARAFECLLNSGKGDCIGYSRIISVTV